VFVNRPEVMADAALGTDVLDVALPTVFADVLRDGTPTDAVIEANDWLPVGVLVTKPVISLGIWDKNVADNPGDTVSVTEPLMESRAEDITEANGRLLKVSEAGTTFVLDDMMGVTLVAVADGPMVDVSVVTNSDMSEETGSTRETEEVHNSEALM